jgi:hypothetical protein
MASYQKALASAANFVIFTLFLDRAKTSSSLSGSFFAFPKGYLTATA